jgi:ABC-type transport system involved in cytochrome c biogenesis permease subunit
MAWLVQFITLLLSHRLPILLSFGFLLSGFFLLVSHLSQMDPQIGRLMPVLNSPLLTIHVGIIMMAYALLSLTFLSSLIGLISYLRSPSPSEKNLGWVSFSSLFLYPALTTLGIGIFTGAIWANVSWGNYWSWDPKETWALITFMAYAIPVHKSLRFSHFAFHLYIVLAFLTILMTYFGVNYFLGGMHSYA